MKFSNLVLSLALLALAGCAAPSTTIKTPMTARPVEREIVLPHNGAIFQAGRNEHPLFEDKHARNVGDILTINIVESISSSQSASNTASHSGSVTANTPTITKGGAVAKTILNPFGVTQASAGALSDKSTNAGANSFTGTITVTVVEVLPNGNLMVGGEKLIAINHDNGYVRFSGVVDPSNIVTTTSGYTVQSTQVADAHLEYKDSSSNIDESSILSMMGRVFLSVLPF